MNKKILNDLGILLYPLLLMIGAWRHWLLTDEAMRTFQIPYTRLAALPFIFLLLLGTFAYYFLVRRNEFHFPVLIIGALELLILLFPGIFSGISESLYAALSGEYLVFGTVLTLYLVLLLKLRVKG